MDVRSTARRGELVNGNHAARVGAAAEDGAGLLRSSVLHGGGMGRHLENNRIGADMGAKKDPCCNRGLLLR